MNNRETVNNKPRQSSIHGRLKKGHYRLGPIAFILSVVIMAGYYGYSSIRPVDQPSPSSFTKTLLPDGWARYEKKEAPKFVIALPEKWKSVEINPDDFEAIAQEWEIRNEPELASYFRDPKFNELARCCIKMNAEGKESLGNNFLQIAVESLSGNQDFKSFIESKIVETEKNLSFINRSHKAYGGAEAEILTFSQEQSRDGKRYYFKATQYYFQKDERIWSVAIGSASEIASFTEMQAPTFDSIVHSFELL